MAEESQAMVRVAADSAEFQERLEYFDMKRDQLLSESKFVLRENPKKTWRAARPPLEEEKVCKQCGKGFKSIKALCGHMACHSGKDRGRAAASARDDHSWTSQNHHSAEERMVRTRSSMSRMCKKVSEDWPFVLGNNDSSSLSEIQQEEMAVCLMMLSRDCGVKVDVNSTSDNNSVVEETKSSSIEVSQVKLRDGETAKMEDSDSDYFLDECGKGESEVSVDCFKKSGFEVTKSDRKGNVYDDKKCGGVVYSNMEYGFWNESARVVKNAHKKSKYECFNCKKNFKSYQALGGHRPCNKRSIIAYGECGENSPDDAAYYRTSSAKKRKESDAKDPSEKKKKKKSSKTKKNNSKPHVCPFCDRVFKSGQALGGHKRSHFLTGNDESSSRSLVEKPDDDIHDLLNLNLPAPEADENDYFSW